MDDFLELGMEGADKLVDKHFDKLPNSALHKDTYDPRNLRKSHRRRRRTQKKPRDRSSSSSPSPPRYSDSSRRPDPNLAYDDPYTEARPGFVTMRDNETARGNYQNEAFSNEPPRPRTQYMPPPSPPPIGATPRDFVPAPGAPPAYFDPGRGKGRSGYGSDDDDEEYYSDVPRGARKSRPGNRRRSSSYHGPRDGQLALARRRKGGEETMLDGVREKAHRYGLKEDFDVFSTSKTGLAGGAVGAVVGGWAAQKAQVATGRDGGRKDKQNGSTAMLTLLGAAVGGLAVNAVIDKFEDRERETKEK